MLSQSGDCGDGGDIQVEQQKSDGRLRHVDSHTKNVQNIYFKKLGMI